MTGRGRAPHEAGRRLEVDEGRAGQRLDTLLAAHLETARNQIQRWIRDGSVRVDGAAGKASLKLEPGQVVEWDPPATPTTSLVPEPGPLAVLYEDPDLVALDKPAGLAVHPGAGRRQGTLVQRLLAAYPEIADVGGAERPGIVHRLDLDTTGVMVLARTEAAYQSLTRAFAARRVGKLYAAIAYGTVEGVMTIDRPLGRHPRHRQQMAVRDDGRPARTVARTLAEVAGLSWLAVVIETGRTHQIRAHLKSVGLPLVGDPVYGEARWKANSPAARRALSRFPRPALHAWRLALPHPISGRALELVAPIPDDLLDLWSDLGGTAPPLP